MRPADYANARVGGMRGRLLGARGLVELVSNADEAARRGLLERAGYPLPEGEAARWSTSVERQPMVEAARLWRFIDDPRARVRFAAALAFLDAATLKAALRGVAVRWPAARLRLLLEPTPSLDGATLDRLVALPDLDAVVGWLRARGPRFAQAIDAVSPAQPALRPSWRARPAPRHAPRLAVDRVDVVHLEVAVDRAVLSEARHTLRGPGEELSLLRDLLSATVDAANAATLLKLDGRGVATDLFLDGGVRLTAARWRHLATLGPAALRDAVARWCAVAWRVAVDAARELASPWAADRLLERLVSSWARRQSLTRPSSLLVPIAYVLARRAEARGVLVALRAAALGLGPDEALDLLEV